MNNARISLLVFGFFLTFSCSYAQRLYSVTNQGGQYNFGTIFSIDTLGGDHIVEYHFPKDEGREPIYNYLTEAPNGNMYGMIAYGGEYDNGVIFEYDPVSGRYTNVHSFKIPQLPADQNGALPYSGFTLASNGLMYGQTFTGGQNSQGILFEFDPDSYAVNILHHFDTPNGRQPTSAVVEYAPDTLIGVSGSGGSNSVGVLYRYELLSSTYTVLHDFTWAEGVNPTGNVIKAGDGNLYGVSYIGGAFGEGSLFMYNPIQDTLIIVHDFSDGKRPRGGLTEDISNDKIYGTTYEGGTNNDGTIFQYDFILDTLIIMVDLDAIVHGEFPTGEFIVDNNGNFVTTCSGGFGSIIEYVPGATSATKIFDFGNMPSASYQGGYKPTGTLCLHSNGNLYGLCNSGGTESHGVLFQFNQTTSKYDKLVNLNGAPFGRLPSGTLTLAGNGKLYGSAAYGGLTNAGTLFEFDPVLKEYKVLVEFHDSIGREPTSGVIEHSNGKFYGVTHEEGGGPTDGGTLFEYDINTQTFEVLHVFNYLTGYRPWAEVTEDANGDLMGATTIGGSNSYGVLYRYDLGNTIYDTLHNFMGATDGGGPVGAMSFHSNGLLYGCTPLHTVNDGTIFTYDPIQDTLVTHFLFNSSSFGYDPEAGMTHASDGLYYGTTVNPVGKGSIFSYNPLTHVFDHKHFLDWNTVGNSPYELIESNGKFYANCYAGGLFNNGTIIEYDPVGNNITKLFDFNGANGANPQSGYVYVPEISVNLSEEVHTQIEITIHPNPTTDFLKIFPVDHYKVTVQDIYGRQVDVLDVTDELVPLSDLIPGIYLLKIESDKSKVIKRIVKQ